MAIDKLTGFWGKFDRFVDIHDEMLFEPAVYAAMIAPVITLKFGGYTVPGNRLLVVRNITVRSPWHSFSTVALQACLVTGRKGSENEMTDYGAGGVIPKTGDVLVNVEAPATMTRVNAVLQPGQQPMIVAAGVPWPEYSGAGGGGIAAHLQGELVQA